MKPQLQALCDYAARRSPVAVMNCVRITETYGYACDAVSSMRCTWEGPKGVDACVDSGLLQGALAGFPDDQHIKIVPGEGCIHLHAGRRKLKLRTVSPDGMPEIKVNGDPVKLPGADLEPALKFAFDATSTNIARPEMANVLVEASADKGVWAVGLDGYRMHAFKLDVPTPERPIYSLIPRALAKRLADLCKRGGDVWLTRYHAVCRFEGFEYICMLASAKFPPWHTILPKDDKTKAQLKAGTATVQHAMLGAKQIGVKGVTMELLPGEIRVSGDAQGDEFEQIVEVDYAGDAAKIMVNPAFIVDAAPHMDTMSDFLVVQQGPGLALVVRSFEATALIQGMRG